MAQGSQPAEGIAVIQYKVALTQGRTLVFDPSRVLILDAELRDSVYGSGTGMHTFRTGDPTFVESLKEVMSDANPKLQFRIGFGSPGSIFWLPWQQHIVTDYYANYEGTGTSSGHLLVINSSNNFVRLARSTKVIARKGTIADIVSAIASENGMESVVEPTDGEFILFQSFLDDTAFLRDRLLKRAINKAGRGGYFLFIKDNVLHFHTPDYQTDAKAVDYFKSTGTELTFSDISQNQDLWDAGVAGTRLINYDPSTGQTKEIDHDPNNALRLADTIYQFPKVVNGQRNIPFHQSFNPPVESKAIAQFIYQRSRQKIFSCSATFSKVINIRHGDLLNLSIVQQAALASSNSGYYYVTSSALIFKNGSVSGMYTLERGEFRGQDQSIAASAPNSQLVPESKAPGQDPNIAAAQSSQLTVGAGDYTGAASYSTAVDPETGD